MKTCYSKITKIGTISIVSEDNYITNLYFGNDITGSKFEETPEIENGFKQLFEYLNGERKIFELPLRPKGTEFQVKVWDSLFNVDFGKTATYGDIAKFIGNEKAYRAVGLANNKNPIPIFIPCHRIVGFNGKLVGYAAGLGIKKFLLDFEESMNCSK